MVNSQFKECTIVIIGKQSVGSLFDGLVSYPNDPNGSQDLWLDEMKEISWYNTIKMR